MQVGGKEFQGEGRGWEQGEGGWVVCIDPAAGEFTNAMQQSGGHGEGRKMAFLDERKAHLNPKCREEVYIDLPEESGAGEGVCGKLVHWIYGMRQAAQAWEAMYSEKLESVGVVRGVGSAVAFYHNGRDISALAHGDDFVFPAEGGGLVLDSGVGGGVVRDESEGEARR